jgi:hypothetical protein
MADVNGIAQIEMLDNSSDIGCVVVHVVAAARLARSAMTAAIMGNHTKALAEEKEHLIVPVVRTQWPTVMKDEWLGGLRAPILVEDLDAILCRDGSHWIVPSSSVFRDFRFLARR